MKGISYLLLAAAMASAQTPTLYCVAQSPTVGVFPVAYFGYTGNSGWPTTIPVGTNNQITGAVVKVVGTVPAVFPQMSEGVVLAVEFGQTGSVSWTINGKTATASIASATSTCATPQGQSSAVPVTAGAFCWDRNANNQCEISEDADGDGFCSLLDCAGPQGLPGSFGAPGPSGPVGPRGPAGPRPQISLVQVSPGAANATALCAQGQILVSGGGSCNVPNLSGAGRLATSTAAAGGNGWSVSCNAGQATAIAMCAQGQ